MEKLTRSQKSYRKHKEVRKAKSLLYSKETNYKAQKEYQKRNPQTDRKKYPNKVKIAIYDILGRVCKNCGFEDTRALQIDHVNGNGSIERKQITGSYYKHILIDLIKNPTKYQILCANCNWIKKDINKENRK